MAGRSSGAEQGTGSQGEGSGEGPEHPDSDAGVTGGTGSRLWHGVGLARATAMDLAVLAGHLVLYPTGMLPERDQAREAVKAHPPVLLLHGFVDNRSTFAVLRRSLHQHGWPQVQALNYSPLIGDIRTAAELLGRNVEQVCAQTGRRRVDVVGHSLGGLIARYYVQRLGGDLRIRTLVTLGTPHSGTRAVPALAPHPIIRQMRPGSEVLAELAEAAPGCRTRFVAFWSDLDQLMIPVEAARLVHPDLPAENVKVSGVGHLALPVHGTVVAEIRRALSGAGPLRPAIEAA
jgi:pimeloyl-ACP methyl ester carboxylesterase